MTDTTWTYDDILLEPAAGFDVSHKNIDLGARLIGDVWIQQPIVMAPMSAISNVPLFKKLYNNFGILPWIHRDMSAKEQAAKIIKLNKQHVYAIAVSSKAPDIDERISEAGYAIEVKHGGEKVPLVVKIDVANGSSKKSINAVKWIKKNFPWVYVFSGNVCTSVAAGMLVDEGADGIMVGIGGGSACTTRGVTGIGVGNGDALHRVVGSVRSRGSRCTVCADGGFRNSGQVAKALALGADICMSGRFFQSGNVYYGMASKTELDAVGKDRRCYEGATIETPFRSTEDILEDTEIILNNLRSAYSYLGCRSSAEVTKLAIQYRFVSRGVYNESFAK